MTGPADLLSKLDAAALVERRREDYAEALDLHRDAVAFDAEEDELEESRRHCDAMRQAFEDALAALRGAA